MMSIPDGGRTGPTTCMAAPGVVRSIARRIGLERPLSGADGPLAVALGMVPADGGRPTGFNDGVIYPPAAPIAAGPGPQSGVEPPGQAGPASSRGRMHALALLVDFPDLAFTRPPAELLTLLFDGDHDGSMASYYRDLSFGKLRVTGEVIGPIRVPEPSTFYAAGHGGTGPDFPRNTPGLLRDALVAFGRDDDLARFDRDGDGFADAVLLIHAGGGAEAEPDAARRRDRLWSHKWTLPAPFEHRGVRVFAYATGPEDGRVGVFAHEFGHILGLPDLYDASYRSRGVGDWCLMGGGSWGGGGDRPTRMCCWCLDRLGWIRPKVVKRARTIRLPPLERDRTACYRLWTKGQIGAESFLIENRQRAGRDAALPGSGLAIWHIDETRANNDSPPIYRVGLVQADGRRDLEFNRNGGDPGDLFPGPLGVTRLAGDTVPSTEAHNRTPTAVVLDAIAEAGRIVTLRVKV